MRSSMSRLRLFYGVWLGNLTGFYGLEALSVVPCMGSRYNAFLTQLFCLKLTSLILGRHKPIPVRCFLYVCSINLSDRILPRKNDDEQACNTIGCMAPHDEMRGTQPDNVFHSRHWFWEFMHVMGT